MCIYQYLNRSRLSRMFHIIGTSLKTELESRLRKLQEVALEAEKSAAATEMLRAAKFRKGTSPYCHNWHEY